MGSPLRAPVVGMMRGCLSIQRLCSMGTMWSVCMPKMMTLAELGGRGGSTR